MAAMSAEALQELATYVLINIERGSAGRIPRRDLYTAARFFEDTGDSLLESGLLVQAFRIFQSALVISTFQCVTYNCWETTAQTGSKIVHKIGLCLSRMGDHQAALAHFRIAMGADPQNMQALYNFTTELLMLGDLPYAMSIINDVLACRPRKSMHHDFEELQTRILKDFPELPSVPRAETPSGSSANDSTPEKQVSPQPQHHDCEEHQTRTLHDFPDLPSVGANDFPRMETFLTSATNDLTPEKQDTEGACGGTPETEVPTRSRRSRRRHRSRSRSNSQPRQPNVFPSVLAPKLNKKEQARQDKMRLRDIEDIHGKLMENIKKSKEKEKVKRERKDSEKSEPSQFDVAPDLRHVVPGYGTKQAVKIAAPAQASKKNDVSSKNKQQDNHVKPGNKTEPPANKQKAPQKKSPEVPSSFNAKFAFRLACNECYVTTANGRRGFCYMPDLKHVCERRILMVAKKTVVPHVWIKIRPRPRMAEMKSNLAFSGWFRMCRQYQEGSQCSLGEARCTFCHSEEERQIWEMDMSDQHFTLNTLIDQQSKWALEVDREERSCKGEDGTKDGASGAAGRRVPASHQSLTCPFDLEEVCGTCWQMFGVIAIQKGNNCKTISVQHKWETHRAYLLKPENQLIRRFFDKRREICHRYGSLGNCSYGNACNFIHGQAESKVYQWMFENQVHSLDDVVAMCQRERKVSEGRVTATASCSQRDDVPSSSVVAPSNSEAYFCKVCNETLQSQLEFDRHCTTRQHEKNLLTDKERSWHYRPPPWGGDEPRLCNRLADGTCPYVDKPDMYNHCKFAHSTGELDEWKERTSYWKYKMASMKNKTGALSYVQRLQEELASVKLESDMLIHRMEGVELTVSPEITFFSNKKESEQTWVLQITSQSPSSYGIRPGGRFTSRGVKARGRTATVTPTVTPTVSSPNSRFISGLPVEKELEKVSLLLDESRLHFRLATKEKPGFSHSNQVKEGGAFLIDSTEKKKYTVLVNFRARLFGSFKQKVVFDFGTRPLLAVSLDAEVGTEFVRDEILKLRKELPGDRWTSKTHTVIPFSSIDTLSPEEEALLCKYKPPDTTIFSQDSLQGVLNHNNYVHMMSSLVDMEELERTRVASRFNVMTEVKLTDCIPGKDIHAPYGNLFARVPLTEEQLSEDSDTGYLMLTGSVTAWVGPANLELDDSRPVVYEAEVVCEANFGFDGRSKDHFYICLSKRCCVNLGLHSGKLYTLAVQLQIDRLPFCRMHHGLEQLPDTSVVFPDMSRYNQFPKSNGPKISSKSLNATQLEIAEYMMDSQTAYKPPLVVYGPFGAGKTEALARAAEYVIEHNSNSRILICALNDSAADLYMTRYLCKSDKLNQQEILRVYSPARRLDTVPEDLHPYCQKTVKARLKLPDMQTIDEHRIIVTTLATSLLLTDQAMRGRFSHILIDEAGQCLECEAILPLTLATSSTCVVLAGDHRQLGPKSFSAEVTPTRLKRHTSILERLHLYYSYFDKKHPGRLAKLLTVNYRSHPKILSFVSQHFYGNALECRSKWGDSCDFEPLAFYTTRGRETTDADSASYCNMAEVYEVVEQLALLYKNWPKSWGEKSPKKIAVLTPYSLQVKLIRKALATREPPLIDIHVSKVPEVQGEEFHAVFITIVRTHHGVENCSKEETFGFYSDMQLMNTAITRAKCRVAVIGDPISLTSMGRCKNIWKSFLECCFNDGCLLPKTLTPGEIRQQVRSLKDKTDQTESSDPNPYLSKEAYDIAEMDADEIIQQLQERSEPAADQNDRSNVRHHIEIIERDEDTVFQMRQASPGEGSNKVVYKRKRNTWKTLQSLGSKPYASYSNEEESDSSSEEESMNDIYQDCNEDEVLTLLKSDRKTYKRCVMMIEGSRRICAHNLDRNDKVHTINISSRLRCNRAFNGDEVVIKILSSKGPSKNDAPHGEVVSILRRAMKVRLCVCRVDPFNTTILVPLNRGIPKLSNLVQENHRRKDAVAIYSYKRGEGIQFQKFEPIDFANPSKKLFLVRFLKWEAKFYSPLGIAIDVIAAPTGLSDGENFLKMEYDIREDYQRRTHSEIEDLYKDTYTLTESERHGRYDFTEDLTFTIDPKLSNDFDDALSVRETSEGLSVGIHIADVSHFVQKDSNVDKEARLRCLTYYQPLSKPVHMLPPRLSTGLCSLIPEEDRLSMSVVLLVDKKDYSHVQSVQVKEGVIRSKYRLTYEDTQSVLDEGTVAFPEELKKGIVVLNKVAKVWRQQRMGDSGHAVSPNDLKTWEAYRLVEEMMIRANHEIARYLVKATSNIVPLRIQALPNAASLHEWYDSYHLGSQHSLEFGKAFGQLRMSCVCVGQCSCLVQLPCSDKVSITNQMLFHVEAALKRQDDKTLLRIFATSMLQPEVAVAEYAYRDIMESAEYRCSGDLTSGARHASLNLEPYLHYTSPIRRYIDIVAHRQIKDVNANRDPSYTQAEIRRICDHCNRETLKQKRYDKEVESLKLNVLMKEQPLVVYPVIEKVQEDGICFRFPTLKEIPSRTGSIPYSDLGLISLPLYDEDKQEVVLQWVEQIYYYGEYLKDHEKDDDAQTNNTVLIQLDPYRFVTRIPYIEWHEILTCIKKNDLSGLRQKAQLVVNSTKQSAMHSRQVKKGRGIEENITMELTASAALVHRIQLLSKLHQGRLTPRVQLLTLTDSLDCCIEHRQDPITCFANITGLKVTRDYNSVKEYKKRWIPLLEVEAALQDVRTSDSYTLSGVKIKWKKDAMGKVTGAMKLKTAFCDEFQVFGSISLEEGYLCVRYSGIKVPEKIRADEIVKVARAEDDVCFVAHCLVTGDTKKDEDELIVTLSLHQSSMPFPDQLLRGDHNATVEAMKKSLPMTRMIAALQSLKDDKKEGKLSETTDSDPEEAEAEQKKKSMAVCLALGRKPDDIDEKMKRTALAEAKDLRIHGLDDANKGQAIAVRKALAHSFSLIHGPPGTGKTVTGVRIACMFHRINKMEDKQNKVLYCGPSNKSVEVVVDYLKRLKEDMRLVRVYSEDIVKLEFPLPTKQNPPRRLQSVAEQQNMLKECRHREYALHKLIRDENHCPEYAGKIRRFDTAFRKEIENMRRKNFERGKKEWKHWKDEVYQYRKLVTTASVHVLARSDIVLLTCVGSAAPILKEISKNFSQLIIDEAGMCIEPEALVPLTSHNPKQVVLIGDHKQLQPIVQSEVGHRLGLSRSMFARYVKDTDMLTIQYRMHEAIAKLPSELFYNDKLTCGLELQKRPSQLDGLWPGGNRHPIAFVNIRGEEKSQVITTADGNEQSKYNPVEAKLTANVVRALVRDRRIRHDCIQVLSQYRAQCKEIREQLERLNVRGVDVNTVIKSQGSEVDYIILSTVRSLSSDMIEQRPTHGWLKRFLGTINQQNQVNVAITRARKGLIIIGNRELLSASPVWRQLLKHYGEHKAIVESTEFLRQARFT